MRASEAYACCINSRHSALTYVVFCPCLEVCCACCASRSMTFLRPLLPLLLLRGRKHLPVDLLCLNTATSEASSRTISISL